jgi:hypothetical protein
MASTIRYSSFPRTEAPPDFVRELLSVFQRNEKIIGTEILQKGLTSDQVLASIRQDLVSIGFVVENSKLSADKIRRPVFYGENGDPALQYEIDAFHPEWRCGLEVEAGRGWMGNAVYRDLIQALVMVQLDVLVLGVANTYRYLNQGRAIISRDYANTVAVADALYGHSRMKMPYSLVVIGY